MQIQNIQACCFSSSFGCLTIGYNTLLFQYDLNIKTIYIYIYITLFFSSIRIFLGLDTKFRAVIKRIIHDIGTILKLSKVSSLAATRKALLCRSVVTSWLLQPCSNASVYHVDYFNITILLMLFFLLFFLTEFKIPSLQLSLGVVVFCVSQ